MTGVIKNLRDQKVRELLAQKVLLQNKYRFDDFDVEDVDYKTIVSDEEYQQVIDCTSDADRLDLLFFFLCLEPGRIHSFIRALSERYRWIAVILCKQIKMNECDKLRDTQDSIKKLQDHMGQFACNNVHRKNYMFAIHKKLMKLEPEQYLMLTGGLGIGKSWLAVDACSNYQVMNKMGHKVFYIDLHQCISEEDVPKNMEMLYSNVVPYNEQALAVNEYNIYKLRNALIEYLKPFEDCLVIFGNVRSWDILKHFQLNCKIMLTTSDKWLLDYRPKNTRVEIKIEEGFTLFESRALFEKVLNKPPLQPDADIIHDLCHGHPLLISIVARDIDKYNNDENYSNLWKNWVEILMKNESSQNHSSFQTAIEKFLSKLENSQLQLFEQLVVFVDRTKIPLTLLERYWGKDKADVKQLINQFDSLFLVETDSTQTFCSLQFYYASYLSHLFVDEDISYLHRRLVNCYKFFDDQEAKLNLVLPPDDGYIYFYIAHHLRLAHKKDLIKILYLDFGFLERKMRATGLSNTIGDLIEILDLDFGFLESCTPLKAMTKMGREMIIGLLAFLPNVEEMLKKSGDTCLLQYAMMSVNHLSMQLEAKRQAAEFPNRLFFDGCDHIQQRRILTLHQHPIFCRFCDTNTCLIASENHDILLINLLPGYTNTPITFKGHGQVVCDIQLLSDQFFVSLDISGECRVWSMKSSTLNVVGILQNRAEWLEHKKVSPKNSEETIKAIIRDDRIICMTKLKDLNGSISVLFGTEKGQIIIYKWENDKLSLEVREKLDKFGKIHTIAAISRSYLVVVSTSGDLSTIDIKTLEIKNIHPSPETNKRVIGIHVVSEISSEDHVVLIVFSDNLIQLEFGSMRKSQKEILSKCQITCSTLTNDCEYLILGTEQGIIVIRVRDQQELKRHNVSDKIQFVAIHNEELHKYILMCGTQQGDKLCYIYALDGEPLQIYDREEPRLTGGRMFAVTNIDKDTDDLTVVAVDSQDVIYRKCSKDKFHKSERISYGKPTVIAECGETFYVGCQDGAVYNEDIDEIPFCFNEPVTYLRCFRENIVLAATHNSCRISNSRGVSEVLNIRSPVAETFLIDGVGGYWLLVVFEDTCFEIWDQNQLKIQTGGDFSNKFGGCHLQKDVFVLASSKEMNFWQKQQSDNDSNLDPFRKSVSTKFSTSIPAACVRLSMSHQFCAVGFENGVIHLFRLHEGFAILPEGCALLVYELISHKSCINDLQFSPWLIEDSRPVILVSLSEQICFWDVTYANKNENKRPMPKHRFSKKFLPCADVQPRDDVDSISSPWIGKMGPSDKPELLSCYKFVGNVARKLITNDKFSQFFTIDEIGAIYLLRISKIDSGKSRLDASINNPRIQGQNSIFGLDLDLQANVQRTIELNNVSLESIDSNGRDEFGAHA